MDMTTAMWATQHRMYPESIEVPISMVYAWADEHCMRDPQKSLRRWRMVVLCLASPGGFFYRIHKDGPLMGYRYGHHDSEYMSGFVHA